MRRLVSLLAGLSIILGSFVLLSPANAGVIDDYNTKATSYQQGYASKLDAILVSEGLTCVKFGPPPIPAFTEDVPKNDSLLADYATTLDKWLSSSIATARSKCVSTLPPPPPPSNNNALMYSDKAAAIADSYKYKMDSYASSLKCFTFPTPSLPAFTEDVAENDKILTEYVKLLDQWLTSGINKINASCVVVSPPPSSTVASSTYQTKAKDFQQAYIDKLAAYAKSLNCPVSPSADIPAIPTFTEDAAKNDSILNSYVQDIYKWYDYQALLIRNKCPMPIPTASPTPTETSSPPKITKEEFTKLAISNQEAYAQKLSAMAGLAQCPLFVPSTLPAIPDYKDDYESNLKVQTQFNLALDTWLNENYARWKTCVNSSINYVQEINNLSSALNDKLKYYIGYYRCDVFTATALPEIKDVNSTNYDAISKSLYAWYEDNFKRVQIECQAINIDYGAAAKQILSDAVRYLDDLVLKMRCKKIEYTAPPLMPQFNVSPHQSLNDLTVYKSQISDWLALNTSIISKYCPIGYPPPAVSPGDSAKTYCLSVIEDAKKASQYTQENITLISDIWSSSQKLISFITGKKITMEQAYSIYQTWTSDEYQKLNNVLNRLAEVKGVCGNYPDIYPQWGAQYDEIAKYLNTLQTLLQTIQIAYKNYYYELPKLVPQIGTITQIVGGCQVQILNYDPTFNWYAKGNLVIDSKGLGTITQSGGEEYLSTYKAGYQTVNYIEKIFACTGIKPTTSIDSQAPKVSLVSLSPETIYKGQAVTVTFLVTDNKEVNTLVVYLIDPVGSVVDRYEGIAQAKRIKGDANVGVYQVDLYARMISYEGKWRIWVMAKDLNSNISEGIDLAYVNVKNSAPPILTPLTEQVQSVTVDTSTVLTITTSTEPLKTQSQTTTQTSVTQSPAIQTLNSQTSTPPPATPNITTVVGDSGIKSIGSIAAIRSTVTQVVADAQESAAIVKLLARLDAAPVSTSSKRITLPDTPIVDVLYQSTTPKVCSVSGATVLKKTSGTCLLNVTTVDSDGNSFIVQKKIVLRR